MRFKILLKMGWSGQRADSIARRLFMSWVLNVLASVAAVRYKAVNMVQVGWKGLEL